MIKRLKLLSLNLEQKSMKVLFNFTFNRQRLHSSNNAKCLGIKIDENLNCKHHVNDVATKLIRASAILFKIRKNKSIQKY